jgi:putative DNA primase/helicase
LGVDIGFLQNRHGPCPICGGRDRYRFDDRDGTGSYFCNQCGAGTGLILIRKLKGWDHRTACDAVDQIIGVGTRTLCTAPVIAEPKRSDPGALAAKVRRLIDQADRPDLVSTYLRKRGLSVTSPVLRGHPSCPITMSPAN